MNGRNAAEHLRIAIVSDLHIHEAPSEAKAEAPSHISTSNSGRRGSLFSALLELIENPVNGIDADLLVCCGDLTNQTSLAGLQHGWLLLRELQSKLKAPALIATIGNHELDSRFSRGVDIKEEIRKLVPPYPPLSTLNLDQYWSRHFAIVESDHWRAVILNSAAYHGYAPQGQPEYDFGRVTPQTVDELRAELRASTKRPAFNLLICHHHLVPMNPFDEKDYSEMKGADKLVSLLGGGEFGQWLVMHGHKHVPRIDYAYGGNAAPIVFGAGSLAATLAPHVASVVSNQFYVVDLIKNRNANIPIEIGGKVTAWDWQPSEGWRTAPWTAAFPHTCGFGWRGIVNQLTEKVLSFLRARAPSYVTFDELAAGMPELGFLLPQDWAALRRDLSSRKVKLLEQNGRLIQLQLG